MALRLLRFRVWGLGHGFVQAEIIAGSIAVFRVWADYNPLSNWL